MNNSLKDTKAGVALLPHRRQQCGVEPSFLKALTMLPCSVALVQQLNAPVQLPADVEVQIAIRVEDTAHVRRDGVEACQQRGGSTMELELPLSLKERAINAMTDGVTQSSGIYLLDTGLDEAVKGGDVGERALASVQETEQEATIERGCELDALGSVIANDTPRDEMRWGSRVVRGKTIVSRPHKTIEVGLVLNMGRKSPRGISVLLHERNKG
jgi:hypothetical protein